MSVDAIARLEAIRARVASQGRVKITELARQLEVSEMTIRRDLDALVDQHLVQRVRGGALALGPQPFAERFGQRSHAKDRIAAKLLELVGDGGAIAIDASTTLQRLAAQLSAARDLTVMTNGPECFNVLQEHPGVTGLLTGGQLDRRTSSLVGPLAVQSVESLMLRVFFTSAAGLDAEGGSSEATLEDAEAKRALARSAAQVIVAVDASKLGARAPARCLAIDSVDVIVTELDADDERLAPFRERCQIL